MSIIESINKFRDECNKLISDFSVIDDNDPITPLRLNYLNDSINNWIEILLNTFLEHRRINLNFARKNKYSLNDYNKKIKTLNDSLSNNIKKISREKNEIYDKFLQKINDSKIYNKNIIEKLEVDYEYFLATSEQNKIILNNDFDDAKKRLDYQKNEAKDSYLEIVRKNNKELDKIKKELIDEHKTTIDQYTLDTTALIEKLNKLIASKTIELNNLNQALETERNNMKEKYRLESANLNENIKKIADDKNKIIDKARNHYNKSINDANIEKENKKQIYQTEAQALLKEFVTKINEIDENTLIKKKQFEKDTNSIKRQYYTFIYEKTNLFHNQIIQIYNSASNPNVMDKYTSNLLKFKNKEHFHNIQIIKRQNEELLLSLNKNYTIELQENKNNKNFLEIDKNFSIRTINNKESFDNKYYQEKNNIYENDFNYRVTTANYQFSQKANLLRSQSQNRTKLLERNYDGIEATYYKKIKSLQNKIDSYQLEINLALELEKLVLAYENDMFNNKVHLESVVNLLEIEKNKLLKEYNEYLYEYNVKNITLAKNYGFKKIELENQRANKFKDLKIKLENLLLEKSNSSSSFTIKKEQLNEKYLKIKTQIINNNDLKLAKEKYLLQIVNNDLDYLKSIITSYLDFFESFKRNYLNVIGIILKDIYPTKANYKYLESLINSFFKIFISLFNESFECMINNIKLTLQERIDYIYEFKYKTPLDTLKDNYFQTLEEIKEKKSDFLDKIDSSNKTIENFRQKIYTLINDNEMLIQKQSSHHKKYDTTSIKENSLKIKEYKEKIDDYTKVIKMYSDDLNELNKKMSKNSNTYSKETKSITKLIQKDTCIYTSFEIQCDEILKSQKTAFNFFINNYEQIKNEKNILKIISKNQKILSKMINFYKDKIEKSFDNFIESLSIEGNKRNKHCAKEFKSEIKLYDKQISKENKSFYKNYNNFLNQASKKIHEHNILTSKSLNYFDNLLKLAKLDFEKQSEKNSNVYENTTSSFFNSYYALEDNNEKIIKYHKQLEADLTAKYNEDKNNVIKKNSLEKQNMNDKLKLFIKTKDEEIAHLPIAYKYNSLIINRETKKKNNQIHLQIKELKNNYNIKRKQIDKEISNLKTQLLQEENENENQQRQNIINEKKNNTISLKNSIKEIKINL